MVPDDPTHLWPTQKHARSGDVPEPLFVNLNSESRRFKRVWLDSPVHSKIFAQSFGIAADFSFGARLQLLYFHDCDNVASSQSSPWADDATLLRARVEKNATTLSVQGRFAPTRAVAVLATLRVAAPAGLPREAARTALAVLTAPALLRRRTTTRDALAAAARGRARSCIRSRRPARR